MEDKTEHLAKVRRYWSETHEAYLSDVGTTFQGGLFFRLDKADVDPEFSNQQLAAAAGIRPNARILDAGCGVCGPAHDIARAVPCLRVAGVTISKEQAATGRELVRAFGLQGQIQISVADYHSLPFDAASFDTVCFFESACYSYDFAMLFREAYRVLRPGGNLYIKDVFHREGELTPDERRELAEFDSSFCNLTIPLSRIAAVLSEVGFADVRTQDITQQISTVQGFMAMFRVEADELRTTPFGKRHFREYRCLPTLFGEVTAVRPVRGAPKTSREGPVPRSS